MSGRNVRRGGLVGAAGVLMVVVTLVAPAFACTELAELSANPASGGAGTAVTVSGAQFLPDRAVEIRWEGSSGALLANATTNSGGSFGASITVPAGARADTPYKIYAIQLGGREMIVEFNKAAPVASRAPTPAPAAPAPAPAPVQSAQPAPVSQPVAAPASQPAPPARQPVAAAPARAATPAPAAAAPAPVAASPAPVAAAVPAAAQVIDPSELQAINQPAAPVQPLVVGDPAAMGSPRTIDNGAPLWMLVPLVMLGLTLFAASSAVVVHEVRSRRVRAKVSA